MINAVNEQFSRFVSFAQERFAAGKETASATKGDVQAGGGTPLEERGITVTDKSDWVGKSLFRKQDDQERHRRGARQRNARVHDRRFPAGRDLRA